MTQEIPVRSLADARAVEGLLRYGYTVCPVCNGAGYRLRWGDFILGWKCRYCTDSTGLVSPEDRAKQK